jgi:predicted hydrocarbon binding protein
MTDRIDLADHQMVALPRASLAALRAALMRDAGPSAATYLQEAGYAGGDSLFTSFSEWLRGRGKPDPVEMDLPAFESAATEYFRAAGWGALSIGSLGEAVATLDSSDWGEADPGSRLAQPGCHLTTGMFASFFGKVADAPLAVLEVECRSAGADRCRFLIGNAQVMEHVYLELERGIAYADAVSELG